MKGAMTAAVMSSVLVAGLNQTVVVWPEAKTLSALQRQSIAEPDAGPRAVKKVVREIIAADNAADLDAVARLYDDEAVWLPPHGDLVRGKNAILSRYRNTFERLTPELSFLSDETHVFGDWAFDRGTTNGKLIPRDGSKPINVNDKYLMILRRSPEGAWRIARLMWSSLEER